MTLRSCAALTVLVLLTPAAGRAHPQEQPRPAEEKAAARAEAAKPERGSGEHAVPRADSRFAASVTLRVQLVISRYQNDKKLASLPYAFVVGARPSTNPNPKGVRMRMGVDTPVPNVTYDEAGNPKSVGVQYRNVGTNIDCWAVDLGDGRYQLNLGVENSSALLGPGGTTERVSGAPLFRRFDTSIDPILRDGQTVQTVASTDPVTGEVVKIDVTLNVLK